jgi:hypothetical protein
MKTLVILTALTMANLPAVAIAACTGHDEQSASSCKDGFVWDSAAKACVQQTNS